MSGIKAEKASTENLLIIQVWLPSSVQLLNDGSASLSGPVNIYLFCTSDKQFNLPYNS